MNSIIKIQFVLILEILVVIPFLGQFQHNLRA